MDHKVEPRTVHEASASVWALEQARLEAEAQYYGTIQQHFDELQEHRNDPRFETLAAFAEAEKVRHRHEDILKELIKAQTVLKSFRAADYVGPSFRDLAPELRENIWKFCLPDTYNPEPGIFFAHDYNFRSLCGENSGREYQEPTVHIAFPVIMHVCRESRAFAKAHLSWARDGTPCRPYRPELDVFYVQNTWTVTSMAPKLMRSEATEANQQHIPYFKEIAHVAVAVFPFDMEPLKHMTSLRHLSYIPIGPGDTKHTRSHWAGHNGPLALAPYRKKDVYMSEMVLDEAYMNAAAAIGIEGVTLDCTWTVPVLLDKLSKFLLSSEAEGFGARLELRDDSPWDKETVKPLFTVTVDSITHVEGYGEKAGGKKGQTWWGEIL